MKRPLRSKKGDMTIPVIVAIVLGLTIIVLSLFIIMGRGKTMSKVGACPDWCVTQKSDCKEPRPTLGLTPCTFEDPSTKKTVHGRCCTDLI